MADWSQFNKTFSMTVPKNGQQVRLPNGQTMQMPQAGGSLTAAGSVQAAMDAANKANEARYAEAKGIYDTMLANSQNFGQLENQRLDQSVLQQSSNLTQDLFSKGLGNTTIGPSMQAGIQQQANLNRTSIADAVARQRNDILTGKAGVIERKQDIGPDLNLFAELQRLASSSPRSNFVSTGGGGGGGGYQPSIFGATLRQPSRSSSSGSGQAYTPSSANKSQHQAMLDYQAANPAETAQRQAQASAAALAQQQAALRQQAAARAAAAQAAAIRASSLYAGGGSDYDYGYDPNYAIYSSLSDGDYDSPWYRSNY